MAFLLNYQFIYFIFDYQKLMLRHQFNNFSISIIKIRKIWNFTIYRDISIEISLKFQRSRKNFSAYFLHCSFAKLYKKTYTLGNKNYALYRVSALSARNIHRAIVARLFIRAAI